ncbi:hypothetical protein [Streptomyces tibetensis]
MIRVLSLGGAAASQVLTSAPPMANAFQRIGYVNFARRICIIWN